jgi:hypothetical protein
MRAGARGNENVVAPDAALPGSETRWREASAGAHPQAKGRYTINRDVAVAPVLHQRGGKRSGPAALSGSICADEELHSPS